MGRHRGFLMKHRVITVSRQSLTHPQTNQLKLKPLSGMTRWAKKLKSKAKAILPQKMDPGEYKEIGQEEKPEPVPKGYMAVYVGQKDGEFQRTLVPVVYFNHPLFGELLKESEKEYGFNQPGGFAIPCRISEFERVQTRIKTVQSTRKFRKWKSWKSV